jgi:uncharacterized protein DUF3592
MVADNKPQLGRYVSIFEMLAGIVLLALSYQMGKAHFALIQHGMRVPGKIIGYQQRQPTKSQGKSATAGEMMPLVEYKLNDRIIHFTDWKVGKSSGPVNGAVTVIYDPLNPAVAMVDRHLWNWMPWAPISLVGTFLVIMAVRTRLRDPSLSRRGTLPRAR